MRTPSTFCNAGMNQLEKCSGDGPIPPPFCNAGRNQLITIVQETDPLRPPLQRRQESADNNRSGDGPTPSPFCNPGRNPLIINSSPNRVKNDRMPQKAGILRILTMPPPHHLLCPTSPVGCPPVLKTNQSPRRSFPSLSLIHAAIILCGNGSNI